MSLWDDVLPAEHLIDADVAAQRMGVSLEELEWRADHDRLLRVWSLADGSPACPVWQFGDDGQPWPLLYATLQVFEGLPRWPVAAWLLRQHDVLGCSPADWIQAHPGEDFDGPGYTQLLPYAFAASMQMRRERESHTSATVWVVEAAGSPIEVYATEDAAWSAVHLHRVRLAATDGSRAALVPVPTTVRTRPERWADQRQL